MTHHGPTRVDHETTFGTFSLDGETFYVDNNVWVVGDDTECVVIDAPHDVEAILAVVGDRRLKAIVCTHAHDDHVRVAPDLRRRANGGAGAPIMLHPDDEPLWNLTHPDQKWDVDLDGGLTIEVGGTSLEVIHTPGHAPGAVCLYAADLGCIFTGDTLFNGGPGATGRSFSDASVLNESIRTRLFTLPADTVVHTGHGDDTTIAQERALLAAETIRERMRHRLPGEEVVP
ncbi:glyoxylase-like metal-dependent hydrolase (beta-lactamase superfamily II) [Nocardioides sp. J9]|uniref:MBL fold metallo-hydrolase n=1 Tax=Nocardioides sp. J9 TaxID=935844 RepID=UPI0011A64664|nr:MBL fold metallo-hydrolase [Nocardioides sp. J9]TWH01741.1 glyoxylase-like metal-dependent hydrolase (beta-lactamase superfamily II) [Nocardioides sp. J9]